MYTLCKKVSRTFTDHNTLKKLLVLFLVLRFYSQCRCTIPELNPEMDVFRVGTLLELCRDIAESLALDGKGVKVCVQQAMGQGVFQV